MKLGITILQGRVSPVLDVAGNLLLVEVDKGEEVRREEISLTCADPLDRAVFVTGLGVDVLICGAVSRVLETALAAGGVRVISFTRGFVEDVLNAFLSGRLHGRAFVMPGCRMRGRGRGKGGRRIKQ